LNDRTPALTYGLRGLAYFNVIISGPGADLHSGVFGGSVFEPMTALVALLGKLVTQDGKILIPGVYDGIKPVDAEEL
jgi:Cys-Gly metallodipeptidase DUG1